MARRWREGPHEEFTGADADFADLPFSSISGDGFKTLAEGESLEFGVTKGPKGLQAANDRKT